MYNIHVRTPGAISSGSYEQNERKVVCMAEGGESGDKHLADKRLTDHDDLQRETAGLEVGRQRRFRGDEDQANPRTRERREARQQAALTALEMILAADPHYRALYNQTMDQIRAAETAAETALIEAESARDRAQEDFQDVLDKAARLEDGTRVFRDAQGNVRREDGSLVSGIDPDTISWPEGAPDYETYLERKEALDRAQQAIEDIRTYQVDVLGAARNELTDPNNPASKERLREIQQDLETQMPDAVEDHPQPESTPQTVEPTDIAALAPPPAAS